MHFLLFKFDRLQHYVFQTERLDPSFLLTGSKKRKNYEYPYMAAKPLKSSYIWENVNQDIASKVRKMPKSCHIASTFVQKIQIYVKRRPEEDLDKFEEKTNKNNEQVLLKLKHFYSDYNRQTLIIENRPS